MIVNLGCFEHFKSKDVLLISGKSTVESVFASVYTMLDILKNYPLKLHSVLFSLIKKGYWNAGLIPDVEQFQPC